MDLSNTFTESTQTSTSDLMQLHRRSSRSHDSVGSARNHDSGILTNSWESNEMSPSRDLLRKTRSRSPSLGRYVLDRDRYKSPTDTMRSNLIATFENIELEKILLKDENRDIRDEMLQLQNHFRLLEGSRTRDAERFDLQQREVDALRLQLKVEKEGRTSVTSLVEELQSDLTRKTELLNLSNEELIEARDRARLLEKQLHEESDARVHVERVLREYRERMEDLSSDLDLERKASRTATENMREEKGKLEQLRDDYKDLQEACRLAASVFGVPAADLANPNISLKNEEALQNIRLIITRRNDLCQHLTSTARELAARSSENTELSDQIQNISRILRLEFREEITPNSLLQYDIFTEQSASLENSKVSAALEPLHSAVIGYVKLEMKKRKVLREAIDATLKHFNWRAFSGSQLIGLLTGILTDRKSLLVSNKTVLDRVLRIRNLFSETGGLIRKSQNESRSQLIAYKNSIMVNGRHQLDEALYKFADSTKSKHEGVRRSMDGNFRKKLIIATEKAVKEQEQRREEAVQVEKTKIAQLEGNLSNLQSAMKAKDNDIDRLADEIRTAESKLFRKTEEIQRLQFEHAAELKNIEQTKVDAHTALYQKVTRLEAELLDSSEKSKRDLDQRAKQIAALDEIVVAKEQKLAALQAKLKERNANVEELKKQLEAEKSPNRDAKLRAAIKTYERETAELRAKITERDQLVTHLKRRVDEALNRGQKRLNETVERTRSELVAKETKLVEKEKEVDKLQEQMTRMSRVLARGPNSGSQKDLVAGTSRKSTERGTILTPQPMVRNLSNSRSVSGTETTRLPPIVPAGVVGGDPNSNGQLTRRFTARSGSEKPIRRSRVNSVSSRSQAT